MNSLLISKETKKKKIAIKTSFIQCKTLSFKPKLSVPRIIYFCKIEKYWSAKSLLLIKRASIAANNKTNPEEKDQNKIIDGEIVEKEKDEL